MSDLAFIRTIVTEVYGIEPREVDPLYTTPFKRVVRIIGQHGERWMLRARRHDLTPIGPPFDLKQWLRTRADLLEHLAERGYPAPPLIRTAQGAQIGQHSGWLSMLLGYVPGTIEDLTPPLAARAASQLAELHLRTEESRSVAEHKQLWSWWSPQQVLHRLQVGLARSVDRVPQAWQAFHLELTETLRRIQHWPALPECIIHGDCWAGNVVAPDRQRVVFIDWDTSGWGPAVLDLGDLLIGCHYALRDPDSEELHLDDERISAVMESYSARRQLVAAEAAVLKDAVRYSSIFRASQVLARLTHQNYTAEVEHELRRQHARYLASDDIADIARQVL